MGGWFMSCHFLSCVYFFGVQALPGAEERTAEAIGSGTGIDDNAAIEAIKAERHHANQVRPCTMSSCKLFLV